MACLGAIGKTAKEMSQALYLPNNNEIIEHGFKDVMDHFKVVGELIIMTISTVFIVQFCSIIKFVIHVYITFIIQAGLIYSQLFYSLI